ncbi:hypothetical protein ASPBRDRAFT_401142 [Aspergillus brasiliensis CBS 101740]|uniref:Aminoglycoside phosphotransferase domain-containing protein n=1 Tax=Aspergillus brasiliensis (strain CBS 101740 / IMI 381727 / IBT 21946) TaxID=767769 RepID=A0A1L9UWZ6_ASPBC|nr:hypothetical protein ASPBRDRAFT_401142 [Aspergillus brasiliensis CBS 101740]
MDETSESSGVPYKWRNLQPGKRYIRIDEETLFPCPSDFTEADILKFPPNKQLISVLDKQLARLVIEIDSSIVVKSGCGVRSSEVEAMKIVSKHTSVPVPEVIMARFHRKGEIHMTIIPGTCLAKKWDMLDINTKESICLQLWRLISKWREIPLPSEFAGLFQCAADGSPSQDPLLEDLRTPPRPLRTDAELRERIYERYLHCGGLRYEHTLPDMLPRSDKSVFTHGDVVPRNIMVDDQNNITGILDWEYAGWYPDYWEYAQIMRPAFYGSFQDLMNKTAPQRWDLTRINASRKVLF